MWTRILVALVGLMTFACGGDGGGDVGGDGDGGGEDASLDAMRPDADDAGAATRLDAPDVPFCHWDCFFARECVDGQVIQTYHAPVDCEDWAGACPSFVAGECSEGCSDRPPPSEYGWPSHLWDGSWVAFCEEGELARVGDACSVDDDCEPPAPTVAGGADYLACEEGACAPTSAPVLPTDVYAPCTIDVEAVATTAHQTVADPGCESGWCELQRDTVAGCVRHACAAPCEGDWDCPDRCNGGFGSPGSCVWRELRCH